ncbi:MAG: tRNA pseudouridine(55) synthase TruB [Planctomycetota bacterium]|jgi:tRNA pseudouridine55 synthase
MTSIHGLLNVHKPAGMTSRRVVDRLQAAIRPVKLGHAGTLDPLASGVLVVCVGPATRLIEFLHRMPKCYRGTFLLGRESPTEDVQGEVTELKCPPVPSRKQIVEAALTLTGQILQRPPAYSALRVEGQRAYSLAREGVEVSLKPRPIVVHRLDVTRYEYPEIELDIECGSGTYVRSLGRDLAESVGTAAVMSGLVRTAIGGFRIEDAVEPERLTRDTWTDFLVPSLRAVAYLPRLELSADEIAAIRTGRAIERQVATTDHPEIAAVDAAGRLVAILVHRGPGLLGPKRNFPS